MTESNPPGYAKFNKKVDSGVPTAFDLEGGIKGFAFKFVGDPKDRIVEAFASVTVDPSQAGTGPLKPQTLQPVTFGGSTTATGNNVLAGVFTGRAGLSYNLGGFPATSYQFLEDFCMLQSYQTFLHVASTTVFDLRGIHDRISIYFATSGGAPTLEVDSSPDSNNYITIDTGLAAAVKEYFGTTVGATTALSPLAFRYLRVKTTDAGAGNTVTLMVVAK